MTASELVSVILPAYNAENYVSQAVRSALEQTYRPLEIIAVDDGSVDGTLDKLKKFGDAITVVRQENQGVFAARMNGVARAKGRFLAFLDADDVWHPDKIASQMELFRRFPEIALAATRIRQIDAEDRPLDRKIKGESGLVCDRPVKLYGSLLMDRNLICLSSVVVRREAFDEVGGFYTEQRIRSADYDLWLKIAENRPVAVCSERLTSYRVLDCSLLHGPLAKEFKAQLGIIEMNRRRYTAFQYKRRLSNLYYDWADSAFYLNDTEGWICLFRSLRHCFWSLRSWILGLRILVKSALILARILPERPARTRQEFLKSRPPDRADSGEPLVSVVIPAYNAEAYLAEAIDSVLAQTYPNIEIIVVDDGSRDGTASVAGRYSGRIVYLYQDNSGQAGARNTGIRVSRGAFIGLLDADDAWEPEKISEQMKVFRDRPEIGAVNCGFFPMDAAGGVRDAVPAKSFPDWRSFLEELSVHNVLTASAVLAKRECFETAGLFDEQIKGAEDWDQWIRIARKYPFGFIEKPLLRYRFHAGQTHKRVGAMMVAQGHVIRKNLVGELAGFRRRARAFLCLDAAREYALAGMRLRSAAFAAAAILRFPGRIYAHDDKWKLLAKALFPRRAVQKLKAAHSALPAYKKAIAALWPGKILVRKPRSAGKVYLTFDDGPHGENTPRLLDILKAHGVPATFFLTGTQAELHPEIVRRIALDGHEVASHSLNHERHSHLDFARIWKEIAGAERAIESACGISPRLFRPPYGRVTLPLLVYGLFRGMTIALWSLDSEDDRSRSARVVLENGRRASAGDIVLCHDDNEAILEALPELIRDCRARGLGFGTLARNEDDQKASVKNRNGMKSVQDAELSASGKTST